MTERIPLIEGKVNDGALVWHLNRSSIVMFKEYTGRVVKDNGKRIRLYRNRYQINISTGTGYIVLFEDIYDDAMLCLYKGIKEVKERKRKGKWKRAKGNG